MPTNNPEPSGLSHMQWIYTAHDSVWELCQRTIYIQIAKRYANGTPGLRDEEWLNDALTSLQLTRNQFTEDVTAIRDGGTTPRLRGEWAEHLGIDIEQVQDEGIFEAGNG